MKTMKTRYGLITFLIVLISVITFYCINRIPNNSESYNRITSKLKMINNDSLSKYYQLFRIEYAQKKYTEADFNRYISNKNQNLFNQLRKNNIKLLSEAEAENSGTFFGFYHIGPDGVDNRLSKNIIFPKESIEGDIMIQTNDYFNIVKNNIYILEKDTIVNISEFNAIKIFAESIPCLNGNVRWKIDSLPFLDTDINYLTFKESEIITLRKNIDKQSIDAILNDSLINTIIKNNKNVYIPFTKFLPVSEFYCDDK